MPLNTFIEDAWFELWADGNAWLANRWGRRVGRQPRAEDFEPLTWELQQLGRRRSAAEHLRSVEQLQAVGSHLQAEYRNLETGLAIFIFHHHVGRASGCVVRHKIKQTAL